MKVGKRDGEYLLGCMTRMAARTTWNSKTSSSKENSKTSSSKEKSKYLCPTGFKTIASLT